MASLSLEHVQNLYRCENKEKRRELLVKALDYPAFDEEEDMRASILLDFYLETLSYASEQGLTWQQGSRLFEMMKELRENALDLQLLEAIELFKSMLNSCVTVFQPDRITSIVDFVFSLFFNHFHLYKFVFSSERETDTTNYHLSVETPPQNLVALTKGMEKSDWDYQHMLKSLEEKHNKQQVERKLILDSEIQRVESLLREKLAMLPVNGDKYLSTDELKSIVKETTKMYVASAGLIIKSLIEENHENLMYQYSKAAMGHTHGKIRSGTLHSPNSFSLKKSATKTKSGKA